MRYVEHNGQLIYSAPVFIYIEGIVLGVLGLPVEFIL